MKKIRVLKNHKVKPLERKAKQSETAICAPARSGHFSETGSCLTYSELRTVAALYNKTNEKNRIPISDFTSIEKLNKALQERFGEKCDKGYQHCWIEQPMIKDTYDLYNKLKSTFRPIKPRSWNRNQREWLNTYDILHVMKQYEDAFDSFEFLGVFPVDFQVQYESGICVVQEMCNFDVQKFIEKGKNSFGVVFNLDKHNEPGSHWVSVYACFDSTNPKFGTCFFDSVGKKPPKEIYDFMSNIKRQSEKLFSQKEMKHFKTKFNNIQKQFKNTECGVFSMVFPIFCLKHTEKTYRQVRELIGNDDAIYKYRDILYSPDFYVDK